MSAPLAHVRADGVWSTGLLDVTALSSLDVQKITMERVAAGATDEVIITVTALGATAGWLFDTAPDGFKCTPGASDGIILPVVGYAVAAGNLALGSRGIPYWRPASSIGAGRGSGTIRYRAEAQRPSSLPGILIS